MTVLASSQTFADVILGHAVERPGKVALETLHGQSLSFADLARRITRLCNGIAARGVSRGSRVAILSRNRPEYIEVYGLSSVGVIVVPLNWRLTDDDLSKIIDNCTPTIVIADEIHREVVDRIRGATPSVSQYILLGETRPGWESYERLIESASDTALSCIDDPRDTLCLIYTSGTTGKPKGVAVSHAGALSNCRVAATEMLSLTEQDNTMAVMPLFHAGGMWYHLFPSLATGCTNLILSEFIPSLVLQELERRRITNVHLVPTMIAALLAEPSAKTADLSCVRLLFYAASSMPGDLLKRTMEAFPSCAFAQGYGSTEAGVVSVLDPAAHRRARSVEGVRLLQSCGKPMSGREVRIMQLGSDPSEGAVGEIEVKSADIMKGYWRNDDATRAVFDGVWLKTGDLGYLDAERFLYIVDRKNDMIVTGGENVFPSEVEEALLRDPNVAEAAVFGVPDEKWVERVVAAVVLTPRSQSTQEEILARLRTGLAAYKCPKDLLLTESLPKNAVGKIIRRKLRQAFCEG